jgi:dipeptidyl aminopeptidase/acylaminoacyl peptidase
MSHRRIRFAVLLFVSMNFVGAVPAHAQSRHIALSDLTKIVSVSDPQISPDGKTIVVVVGRQNIEQDRTERELVQIDIASRTPHALTYERKTVGSPRWSPGGDRLAFTANDGAGRDAKPQIFILSMSGGEAKKISDAPNGIEQFAWRPDGREIAYVSSDEPENRKEIEKHNDAFEVGDNDYLTTDAPQPSHIWLISAEGGKAKRLTSGEWSLPKSAPPGSPASPISWSPDGQSLLFTRQEHPHQGDADLTTLQVLNVGTGATRKLTKHEKFESFGVFSPDGSRVAYWYPRDGRQGEIAFTGSTPTQPSELYYLGSANDTPKRLTDFNHEIGALRQGKVEKITWKGPDNFQPDGVLVYPPDFQRARKYPLVLIIHGGPQASSTTAFSFLPQLMATHGYVVFSPNYRGSDNLGNAYQRAIWNDAGDGPGRDVIAGIEAVKKLGFVDESKIGVTGWSYGGYVTSWLIGHYQIWKAAMAGAPVTDMYDEYNLSDGNVAGRYGFRGSPYIGDNLKDYRAQSPITYTSNTKTPTLIMHDTGDARVTVTQGYSLYHALKDNGVPVKFVAFPIPGHAPGDPVRRMEMYRRWVEWMDQYLK